MPNAIVLRPEVARQCADIDRVLSETVNAELSTGFAAGLELSLALQRLRELVTPEMVRAVMPLQNSALGFLTDKPDGYGEMEIRDCLIEAMLGGVRPVGNEFNIINRRVYVTKNGYARKVREWPGLADLQLVPGVPMLAGGGALVPYVATALVNNEQRRWERIAKPNEPDQRIPVRVNQGMGADAILGKATRKMLAYIWSELTGSKPSLPEGEVDDIVLDGRSRLAPERAGVDLSTIKESPEPNRGHGHEGQPPETIKAAPQKARESPLQPRQSTQTPEAAPEPRPERQEPAVAFDAAPEPLPEEPEGDPVVDLLTMPVGSTMEECIAQVSMLSKNRKQQWLIELRSATDPDATVKLTWPNALPAFLKKGQPARVVRIAVEKGPDGLTTFIPQAIVPAP